MKSIFSLIAVLSLSIFTQASEGTASCEPAQKLSVPCEINVHLLAEGTSEYYADIRAWTMTDHGVQDNAVWVIDVNSENGSTDLSCYNVDTLGSTDPNDIKSCNTLRAQNQRLAKATASKRMKEMQALGICK